MNKILPTLLTGTFPIACVYAAPNVGSVQITPYPTAVMADGKSVVNISIEVRDRDGKFVPDGTQITLSASLGQLRDSVISTNSGVARTVLISGTVSGFSKITVNVLGFPALGEIQVQFAGDKRALMNGADFVEVSGRQYLAYFNDVRWVAASGRNSGAAVKYRDIEITADDLQMDAAGLRVIARNANLKVGKDTRFCRELSYTLNTRKGLAVTDVDGKTQTVMLENAKVMGKPQVVAYNEFRMRDDLSENQSYVTSSWITIFPSHKVQFHRANIFMGGSKVMSLPLYSMDMWNTAGQVFSSNMVGYNDGQISLDVPVYYSLTPRSTGALHLRTQQRSGGSNSFASHGVFLDMEQNYSSSDKYDGAFTISDVIRSDWGMNWHHHQRFSKDLQAFIMLDMPQHQGLFGTTSITKQFARFHTGFNLSAQKQFTGFDSASRNADLYIETDPQKIKHTPFNTSFGLTSNYSSFKNPDGTLSEQQGSGLRWRAGMDTIKINSTINFRGGLTISKLFGTTASNGVNVLATLATDLRMRKFGNLGITYDFSQDGLSSNILGSHRISGQYFNTVGKLQFSMFGTKALDADYSNLFGDISYRINPMIRLGCNYSVSEFSGYHNQDYSLLLGFRVGVREIALTWSKLTNRLGVELLTAGF